MLPKSINVLGKKYKIKEVEGLAKAGAFGMIRSHDSEILIDKDENNESKMRTLMHEVGHAALYRNGMAFGMDAAIEEAIVEVMATAHYELMQQILGKDWHE